MTRFQSALRATSALFCSLVVASCGFVAVSTAPAKTAVTQRSEAALRADGLFWQTLHSADYDAIPAALVAVQAAYLETPGDASSAAHIAFLHIWRIAERARMTNPSPLITNDMVVAQKYFQEAVSLDPSDARYLGFLGASQLSNGAIHHDQKLTRQGHYTMRDAVKAWPEFNLFTAGYVMSGQPADSDRFKEALDMQWRTLDACAGTSVDRRNPAFDGFMDLQTLTGPKRACWNSWIAPHNFEGFFLNMGDMLVKAGDWQTAQKVYANARLSPDYGQWQFRPTLETRIAQAQANVSAFNAPPRSELKAAAESPARVDAVVMNQSRFACMACHQR